MDRLAMLRPTPPTAHDLAPRPSGQRPTPARVHLMRLDSCCNTRRLGRSALVTSRVGELGDRRQCWRIGTPALDRTAVLETERPRAL
jgi:hypothetical protein